jgi:hypothetical protein
MIIGSLSGPLCAAGGFCAGNEEVVEHQRISSASYTYSAALPALLSTTASETISLLQEQPEILTGLRENVKAMRAQLDPRSDWIRVSSSADNPIMLLVLKQEVIEAKKLTIDDQNQIFREVVDEVCSSFHFVLPPNQALTLRSASQITSSSQGSKPFPLGWGSILETQAGNLHPPSKCVLRVASPRRRQRRQESSSDMLLRRS